MDFPKEKACSACREPKPRAEFYSDRRRPDGLMAACRQCHHARTVSWRQRNKERSRQICREYRESNPTLYRDYARRSYAENPAKHRAATRRHAAKNREAVNEKTRAWFKKNPAKAVSYVRAREARKLRQTLPHCDAAMEAIYERAQLLTEITGVPHHVDHIVPLKGSNVRGLHVPWNLQCIPADENRRKQNKLLAA